MQNAGIAVLGLDWRYLAFEVAPENLLAAIAGAKAMGFIGLNLTVPHKMLAYEMVDLLDDSARTWRAVNTIKFEGRNQAGEWRGLGDFEARPGDIRAHGFNTDADAIVRALREDLGLQLSGRTVLLLGAGGAGRTAALRLAAEQVSKLYLMNRTRSKAEELGAEIGSRFPKTDVVFEYPSGPVDLVLNATSLGLKPSDPLPFDEKRFSFARAAAAFDMIYRPARTPFLEMAAAGGCRTANGLGMLLYQGAKALEIWTGRPAPIEAMRRALEANVYGSA